MRAYNYFTFGVNNGYGQPQLSQEAQGTIKIAIYNISNSIADNIKYKEATYIGLTQDAKVDDTYVIEHNGAKLKVLYVVPQGRFKQVFMAEL